MSCYPHDACILSAGGIVFELPFACILISLGREDQVPRTGGRYGDEFSRPLNFISLWNYDQIGESLQKTYFSSSIIYSHVAAQLSLLLSLIF
jgi:hypothetical protein